jgi:hypothetical protein
LPAQVARAAQSASAFAQGFFPHSGKRIDLEGATDSSRQAECDIEAGMCM